MRVLIASGLCFFAGGLSALYVSSSTFSWYNSLNRPLFFALPLPALFFVLIVTYALISMAASLMWIHDPRPYDFRGWVPLFFTHLLLNASWLILFFGYNVVFVAMIIAFVLATYVMILAAAAWDRSKLAFWLLIPYFMWTLYALGMNMAIWLNN